MRPTMKLIVAVFLGLVFSLIIFQVNSYARRGGFGTFDSFPGPQLVFPLTDDIALDGKNSLVFKWICRDAARTDFYDFRLYKGYNMVESTLLMKKNVSGDTCSFEVSADLLEENQVYTWSLKRVFISGEKSDKSFSSFKIIKK